MAKPTIDLTSTCFNLGTWQSMYVEVLPPEASGHIAKHNRTLGLRCHDRHFRDAVVCDEQGDKLFDFTAKDIGTSWTLRRSLKDTTTGQRLLDLRHTKTSYKVWVIEDPDGNEFCKIKDTTSIFSSKFTSVDAQILGNGGRMTIEMRSFDASGSRTTFQVDGTNIAEMTLTDNNDATFLHKRGLDRTTWKLEVAQGVDIALIVALAFARAEISHAWRR
ncbi:hypothetical protein E4T47_06989 [Aureobasidium subglaciale]|nr:hypothetical protein E4T47_06989 [Aureobasidium subglaciale]